MWFETPEPRVTDREREERLTILGTTYHMQVEKGTQWRPSIPQPFHFLATEGVWWAALWHDEFYVWQGKTHLADYELTTGGETVPETGRLFADWFFLRSMKREGVGFVRRWIIFLAVLLFGWAAWMETDTQLREAQRDN